ncbi:ArsR/SmtB family transcription factor [Miniphocaeibacter massiliensis]|uniref:ArsR/SmtB family transcription factor n=1 Tax=Miniphocaeibacter massiliensis TaxID=2041841 RepID=UPI000C1C06F6|nr:metalloregulator ArsR/SmtB family transcription factor [Miniphocaeibacter massiliensis]
MVEEKELEDYIDKEPSLKVTDNLPMDEDIYDLADFYKLFSDSTRLKILIALGVNELCVTDLAKVLKMGQSAISHQLRILKQGRLVRNRREGKVIYYQLDDDHIKEIISSGLEHIEE